LLVIYTITKLHENPSSGSRVVLCGQTDGRTDRHDEANSRFPQFCKRTNKSHIGTKRAASVRDERGRTTGTNTDRARSVTGQLCSTDWGVALRFKWSVMWRRVDWWLQTLLRTRGLNQQHLLSSWLLDLEVKDTTTFRNVGNY